MKWVLIYFVLANQPAYIFDFEDETTCHRMGHELEKRIPGLRWNCHAQPPRRR